MNWQQHRKQLMKDPEFKKGANGQVLQYDICTLKRNKSGHKSKPKLYCETYQAFINK